MKFQSQFAWAACCLVGLCPSWTEAAEPDVLIRTIQSVDEKGKGNVEASAAFRELVKEDAAVLMTLLNGLDDANPLASNWLRGAFEAIADRTLSDGGKLPAKELETFLLDRKHNPRVRRLAFEYLSKVDESVSERLVPGMINDPSSELRREAVERLIDSAGKLDTKTDKDKAVSLYQKALLGATDDDLVKAIVAPLKKLGVEVNLHEHFGFLTQWQMVGPFDNKDKVGYAAVYPPEKALDLKATYKGQLGEVKWQPVSLTWEKSTTDGDRYGIMDVAKQIKNYKGSVMYATTEYNSSKKQTVQIRIGTPNSWKLWVNGKLLFGREEYHRGMKLDQYKVDAELEPGKNVILLKLCQNEQTQSWAQRYQYQVRVSNPEGIAILSQAGNRTSQINANTKAVLTALGEK